ncbi:extracellular solute-binding protein [Paenibacillus psychroresistens]|uniref:Extracellular solute-binding protein n=1 Tax=Paenibacillus psychroresistens TaxID=1778678 RepID=A0A6B8RF35_9BACL|nr:extracellular solute-binding protein [Paenibacillus psychroresistens]QGQ95101.1 extracellular solute-binding protein [Paenibacillus psychroresistens]
MKKMTAKAKRTTMIVMLLITIIALTACSKSTSNTEASASPEVKATVAETAAPPSEEPKAQMMDETVSMLIPAAQYKEKSYKQIIAKIKEKTGITIDLQVTPDNQLDNLVKTKIAANEVPDLLHGNAGGASGPFAIYPDDAFTDLSDQSWVSRLVNKDFKTKDGKYIAAPINSTGFVLGMFYNKDIFTKLNLTVPTTWADFIKVCEAIKASGVTPVYMMDKDLWTIQIWETVGFGQVIGFKDEYLAVGQQVLENKIKMKDIPKLDSVLSKHLELVQKELINKDHITATYDGMHEIIGSGKAAMVAMGQWEPSELDKKYPGISQKFGMFPIPFEDNAPMFVAPSSSSLLVFKNAKHLEAAKRVVEAWTQPDVISAYYEENPGFSAYTDVPSGNVLLPIKEVEDNYIKKGNITASVFGGGDIAAGLDNDIWKMYQDMLAGGKTPTQVLESMDKRFAQQAKAKSLSGW